MTQIDAGPLIALIDADEPDHQKCVRALASVTVPLLTTWPAFTEAMYLLGRIGIAGQRALWTLVGDGRLRLAELAPDALARSAALMEQYQDLPMNLADATLVVLAETRDDPVMFTLDSDFDIYRLHGRKRFRIIPGRES